MVAGTVKCNKSTTGISWTDLCYLHSWARNAIFENIICQASFHFCFEQSKAKKQDLGQQHSSLPGTTLLLAQRNTTRYLYLFLDIPRGAVITQCMLGVPWVLSVMFYSANLFKTWVFRLFYSIYNLSHTVNKKNVNRKKVSPFRNIKNEPLNQLLSQVLFFRLKNSNEGNCGRVSQLMAKITNNNKHSYMCGKKKQNDKLKSIHKLGTVSHIDSPPQPNIPQTRTRLQLLDWCAC